MFENIVGPWLKSPEGEQLVRDLGSQGLDSAQAERAIQATAEGVERQARTGGILSQGGGMGALAGGMLGGHGEGAASVPPGLLAPIAQFVADKTGLSQPVATQVAAAILPRLLAHLHAKGAATGGGLGGLLRQV